MLRARPFLLLLACLLACGLLGLLLLALVPEGPLATADKTGKGKPVQELQELQEVPESKGPQEPDPSQPALPSVQTPDPYAFEEWHQDFPYAMHMPPRASGRWYARSRSQALRQVVQNLQGSCTREAWLMAKEFFSRHFDVAGDLLVETLDGGLIDRNKQELAENIVRVLGQARDPKYAPALLRAFRHESPGLRRLAMRSLIHSGDEKSVLAIWRFFLGLRRSEQLDWIKAAVAHLGDEALGPILKDLLTNADYEGVRGLAIERCLELEPKRAVKLLDPVWNKLPLDMALHVSGLFHAAGDNRGTVRLRHALRSDERIAQIIAAQGAVRGDAGLLLDDLLTLTMHGDERLDLAIAIAIRDLPGQNVTDVLTSYTDRSFAYQVRQTALFGLKARGETAELDALLEDLRTGEGNRLSRAVADLVGAKYEKAVPILLQRYETASPGQQVYFTRMVAAIGGKDAFVGLRKIFMQPEKRLVAQPRHSNVSFLGIQLSNLRTCVPELLEFLDSLPRGDYRRRATLAHVLANTAGAYSEESWNKDVYDRLRKSVFDLGELPQMRILALDYLRKDIRLADAMRLRAHLEKEEPRMRKFFSDYLFEFF